MAALATWQKTCVNVLQYPFMIAICGKCPPDKAPKEEKTFYSPSAVVTEKDENGEKIRFPVFLKLTLKAKYFGALCLSFSLSLLFFIVQLSSRYSKF